MGSVAVAVTTWPAVSCVLVWKAKWATPLALVVAVMKPRNVWPSGMPPAGSGALAKNSIRNLVFGVIDCVRVPVTVVPPGVDWADVSTGKFWKLLGSLGAPWPLESLGVTPSSGGNLNWLV